MHQVCAPGLDHAEVTLPEAQADVVSREQRCRCRRQTRTDRFCSVSTWSPPNARRESAGDPVNRRARTAAQSAIGRAGVGVVLVGKGSQAPANVLTLPVRVRTAGRRSVQMVSSRLSALAVAVSLAPLVAMAQNTVPTTTYQDPLEFHMGLRPAYSIFADTGVMSYTAGLANVTDPGAAYGLHVNVIPIRYLGVELGYDGSLNNLKHSLSPNGTLFGNEPRSPRASDAIRLRRSGVPERSTTGLSPHHLDGQPGGGSRGSRSRDGLRGSFPRRCPVHVQLPLQRNRSLRWTRQ